MNGQALAARSAQTVADVVGFTVGVGEVSADGLLDLLTAAQQPKDDEERHHGGDEIRVGYFPGAAVMARVATLLPADDDDRLDRLHGVRPLLLPELRLSSCP